jgi:CRISPR-associated protein Cas6
MTTVELCFPVLGSVLPTDHHYPLYAAASAVVPWLHDPSSRFALAPIPGRYVGEGQLRLEPWSRLRLRLRAEDLPRVLPLAGKSLRLLGQALRLGAPHVEGLRPVADLLAHTVTIRGAMDVDSFALAARKQLDALPVGGVAAVPRIPSGPRQGQPQRQVMRVKDSVVVGFPLRVSGLSAEESLRLQVAGVGGRRRMGGGFFLPARAEEGGHV